MTQKIIELLATIAAASFIMIFHELSKAIVYNLRNKDQSAKTKRNIFKIQHYIDPIGLVFCITTLTGFSKPYMYRIKEKKTNFLLGITGFLSLILLFVISLGIFVFNPLSQKEFTNLATFDVMLQYFLISFNYLVALLSLTMVIANLFPISTFDMGLLIAGKSPSKYFSIIKNDQYIKAILLLTMIFNIIQSVGLTIISTIL